MKNNKEDRDKKKSAKKDPKIDTIGKDMTKKNITLGKLKLYLLSIILHFCFFYSIRLKQKI